MPYLDHASVVLAYTNSPGEMAEEVLWWPSFRHKASGQKGPAVTDINRRQRGTRLNLLLTSSQQLSELLPSPYGLPLLESSSAGFRWGFLRSRHSYPFDSKEGYRSATAPTFRVEDW
uniref:Chaperone protein htpG n=1 Tax=Anthurium amnicola TaxID=1678845 RepID=A0A1D1XPZ0_9ARAE